MYQSLTFLHSTFRWIALLLLIVSVARAWYARRSGKSFTKTDNALRHWTATTFHVQLIIGLLLYFFSPIVELFWNGDTKSFQVTFFALIHSTGMFIAVFLVTLGSAFAKRAKPDSEKFAVVLSWFVPALILVLVLIPWPFSPLAARPYFR